jgi:hypothetical protein
MIVLLKVKDNKANFILELLNNFPFVKAESISPAKAQFIEELKTSVEEVNLAKEGKIKLKTADQLLDL